MLSAQMAGMMFQTVKGPPDTIRGAFAAVWAGARNGGPFTLFAGGHTVIYP